MVWLKYTSRQFNGDLRIVHELFGCEHNFVHCVCLFLHTIGGVTAAAKFGTSSSV